MLRLSDLATLPRPGSGREDRGSFDDECQRRGLVWPPSVIGQFLFDHGNNPDFIAQYDHLDLSRIVWETRRLPAKVLAVSTFYEDFGERVHSVASHPQWTLEQYYEGHGVVFGDTWKVPPLLIQGRLRRPPQSQLHLLEGHTRLGVLIGLLRLQLVGADSMHNAYVAEAGA